MKKRRITTVKGYLQAVKQIIESGWTQHRSASDRHSHSVDLRAPNAVRFCMSGALCRVDLELAKPNEELRLKARRQIQGILGGDSIVNFNDTTGRKKSEVIEVLNEAIRAAS